MPRSGIKTYRDLVVWDKAMDLAVVVYRFCDALPPRRFFALGSQLRGAAGSIPSNIAEGYGRRSRGDYMRFVSIANGSLCELQTRLLLIRRIESGYESVVDQILPCTDQVGRMLTKLRRALKNSPARP
ncbi:MAG TPA: four helix bundle protein [Gemmatimonadales bacterium]|nr:four helix bundle protein [Gemmatimonadales bacterium]